MIFSNPEIIRDNNDIRIGSVQMDSDEISFNNYTLKVKHRIIKLVAQYVRGLMGEGLSYEEAIKETANLVYGYLNISKDDLFAADEEQIADDILKSFEYQNWETKVYYRFLETHVGVTTKESEIPAGGELHKEISEETILHLETEESLWTILEALVSANL
jgi:hypothetical protein